MIISGFPFSDVTFNKTSAASKVKCPSFSTDNWQAGPREFSMQVPGVGDFYAKEGNYIEYFPVPRADPEWIKLYLNGQVLVALLHQRKIINFHASSFVYDNLGVMILGETGAGKSSLTASFILGGAGFLSDDLTPIFFRNDKPHIMALGRDIKLRANTVGQLNIGFENLKDAEAGTGKQYLQMEKPYSADHPVDTIMKIEVGNVIAPEFYAPAASEKFTIMRSEICLWEMLAGMPETEAEYLQQLVKIVEQVKVVRVVRPAVIEIGRFHKAVSDYLDHDLTSRKE
jgi:hypothetical protein